MGKTQKHYWDMTVHELVEEWWDNDMSKYDEENGFAMPESQRQYYLWRALARDIEWIKKVISPPKTFIEKSSE